MSQDQKPVTAPRPSRVASATAATPYLLRVAASVGVRVLVVVACLVVLVKALGVVREEFMPVMVALLLTALLSPVAGFLRRRLRFPRYLAAVVTLLLFAGVVLGLLTVMASQLSSGSSTLADDATTHLSSLVSWLKTGPLHLQSSQITSAESKVVSWLREHQSMLTSNLASYLSSIGGSVVTGATETVIALISTLFFLADGGHIWGWLVRLLPRSTGQPVHEAMRRAWVAAGSYVRTQLVVACCDAVGIGVGARLLGLPMVVPIAILVVICAFIPVIGALLSGVVAVAIALLSAGVTHALIMVAVVIVVQQLESHVMGPLLMSHAVDLHPWAIIIGVAVGYTLEGIPGALFAVPVMAMANVAVLYLRGQDRFPQLGADDAVFHPDATASADDQTGPTPDNPRQAAEQRAEQHDPDQGPSQVPVA